MPIEKRLDKDTNDEYYSYVPPDADALFEDVKAIEYVSLKYAEHMHVPRNSIFIDYAMLGRIAVRVDQRAEYYKIYHDNTYLGEIRKASLVAYWILKYRPLRIEMADPDAWQNGLKINEVVALNVILSIIVGLLHGEAAAEDVQKALNVSHEYRRKILHSFAEHDLSKEAIMIIAESLLEQVVC